MNVLKGVTPFRPENALVLMEAVAFMMLCSTGGDLTYVVSPTLFLCVRCMFTRVSHIVGVWDGIKLFVGMHLVCSYVFAFVGLIAAHHHPHIWHDGDILPDDVS